MKKPRTVQPSLFIDFLNLDLSKEGAKKELVQILVKYLNAHSSCLDSEYIGIGGVDFKEEKRFYFSLDDPIFPSILEERLSKCSSIEFENEIWKCWDHLNNLQSNILFFLEKFHLKPKDNVSHLDKLMIQDLMRVGQICESVAWNFEEKTFIKGSNLGIYLNYLRVKPPFPDGIFTESLKTIIIYDLINFWIDENLRKRLHQCRGCNKFYISKTLRFSIWCSDKCRLKYHNTLRIKSGKQAAFMRNKRLEGKYQ
jgi:hypothetical protein